MNHSASRSVKLGQLGKSWSLLGTFGTLALGNHLACQEMDMKEKTFLRCFDFFRDFKPPVAQVGTIWDTEKFAALLRGFRSGGMSCEPR